MNKKIPWCTVSVHKLIVAKIFKTYLASGRFIIAFTKSYNWILSWVTCILSTSSHNIYLRCILMLSSPPCLSQAIISFKMFSLNSCSYRINKTWMCCNIILCVRIRKIKNGIISGNEEFKFYLHCTVHNYLSVVY